MADRGSMASVVAANLARRAASWTCSFMPTILDLRPTRGTDDDQVVSVHDLALVVGAELGGEVAGRPAQQLGSSVLS